MFREIVWLVLWSAGVGPKVRNAGPLAEFKDIRPVGHTRSGPCSLRVHQSDSSQRQLCAASGRCHFRQYMYMYMYNMYMYMYMYM